MMASPGRSNVGFERPNLNSFLPIAYHVSSSGRRNRAYSATLYLSPILLVSRMSGRASSVQIDSIHCRAISEEIGYRLSLVLRKENPELPPRLKMLLDRLGLQDMESAPSMAPSLHDMVPLETNIPA